MRSFITGTLPNPTYGTVTERDASFRSDKMLVSFGRNQSSADDETNGVNGASNFGISQPLKVARSRRTLGGAGIL